MVSPTQECTLFKYVYCCLLRDFCIFLFHNIHISAKMISSRSIKTSPSWDMGSCDGYKQGVQSGFTLNGDSSPQGVFWGIIFFVGQVQCSLTTATYSKDNAK